MITEQIREQIASKLREGLIKDFNKLYVPQYTATWDLERVCREAEIRIMSFDTTVDFIHPLIEQARKEGRESAVFYSSIDGIKHLLCLRCRGIIDGTVKVD